MSLPVAPFEFSRNGSNCSNQAEAKPKQRCEVLRACMINGLFTRVRFETKCRNLLCSSKCSKLLRTAGPRAAAKVTPITTPRTNLEKKVFLFLALGSWCVFPFLYSVGVSLVFNLGRVSLGSITRPA